MGGKAARQPITGPQWFVVQTQPHHERLARSHLINQKFEVYLPMRCASHPRSKNPITPFLPRYLFVRFDLAVEPWLSICSTVGVHDVIRRGDGRPSPVSAAEIERLRGMERDGVIHLIGSRAAKANPFKAGDRVDVVSGPFAGFAGLVTKTHDAERVSLMLRLVERGESGFKITSHVGALKGADVR